jgi:hypothetical protein
VTAIACSACGGRAAEIRAADGGIVREGFLAKLTIARPADEAAALVARLEAGPGLAALAADDPADLFTFVCVECGRAYCQACWAVEPPEFDDGFYDCTHAVCPSGHRQLVDD